MKKNYRILLCEDSYDDSLNTENAYFAGGLKSRAVCELASNDSTFQGQAYNISFYSKIDGTHELAFSIPRYYFDESTGEKVINDLVDRVVNKSKIELTIEEEGEENIYYFTVNTRQDQDNNDILSYSYTCTDTFIEELSKTGYGLTFTSEVGVLGGLGTIHELAERIVDGTDWDYVQDKNDYSGEGTGTLFEYKTELSWNEEQDRFDEVYKPLPSHPIKYIPELKRYCYETELFKNTNKFGDVNMDGVISQADAQVLYAAMNAMQGIPYPSLLKFTHVDGDEGESNPDRYYGSFEEPDEYDLEQMYLYILQKQMPSLEDTDIPLTDITPTQFTPDANSIRYNFSKAYFDGVYGGQDLDLTLLGTQHEPWWFTQLTTKTTTIDGVTYSWEEAPRRLRIINPGGENTDYEGFGWDMVEHFKLWAKGEYNTDVFWNEMWLYGQLIQHTHYCVRKGVQPPTTPTTATAITQDNVINNEITPGYIRYRLFCNPVDVKEKGQRLYTTRSLLPFELTKKRLNSSLKENSTQGENFLTKDQFFRLDMKQIANQMAVDSADINRLNTESTQDYLGSEMKKWQGDQLVDWHGKFTHRHGIFHWNDSDPSDRTNCKDKIFVQYIRQIRNNQIPIIEGKTFSGNTDDERWISVAKELLDELKYFYITSPKELIQNYYGTNSIGDGYKRVKNECTQGYLYVVLNWIAFAYHKGNAVFNPGNKSYYYGDINLDGVIDMLDYEMLRDYLSKKLDEAQLILGNVYPDLHVTATTDDFHNPAAYTNLNIKDINEILGYLNETLVNPGEDDRRVGKPAYNIDVFHRIYCYEDTDVISANTINNMLYNASNFNELTGWNTYTAEFTKTEVNDN